MNAEGNITVSSTYYHPLLRKINRREILDRFDAWLGEAQLNTSFTDEEKRVLIELLVISVAECRKANLESENNLILSWSKYLSPLQVRFSRSSLKSITETSLIKAITTFLIAGNDRGLEQFIKFLSLEMSLAEYRGVEYPEERAEVPMSMLPTSERRSFFISLVPLNTKWKI